jgi:hypothetical protein
MVAQAILARRQVDAIEASFEAWRADVDTTRSEQAALLAAAVHWTEQMERWQTASWKHLFSKNRTYDFQLQGRRLAEVYSLGLTVFDRLETSLETARGGGLDVEGVEAFRKARESLDALYTDFRARWPLFTGEELEAGAAEIARGECVTLEEAIRELDAQPRP